MITILLTLMVPIVLFAPQAYAESYVAGQFGATPDIKPNIIFSVPLSQINVFLSPRRFRVLTLRH